MSIDTIQAAWKRRKWLAIPAFLFPLAATATLVLALPTIYRSSAVVIVERQKVPEAFVRATVTDEIGIRLRTVTEQVLSQPRLEGLIGQFHLYPELRGRESMEQIIVRMRKDVQIVPSAAPPGTQRGSVVAFSVGFQSPNPETVADVANALASFFVDENLKVRERQSSGTTMFLETQLTETKRRLDEQDRLVSEFTRLHLGELPSQMTANLAALDGLHMQLRLNIDSQARAGDRRRMLAQQLEEQTSLLRATAGSGAAGAAASQTAAAMPPGMSRLVQLREALVVERTRYTDSHPSVARLKSEIAELEQSFGLPVAADRPAAETAGSASRSLDIATLQHPQLGRLREQIADLDAQSRDLKTQEGHLVRDIATYRARVENTPRREQESQALTRDYGAVKELYQVLLKRYDEARLAESMEQRQEGERFRLRDRAVPPHEVVAPRRGRLLFMALALSGTLALVALVLAEKLDASFHTAAELRAFTSIPVMASIPRIVTSADRQRQRWRVGLGTTAAASGLVLVIAICYTLGRGNLPLVRLLLPS